MGSHGSTTDTANWLEQPVAIISGRQHSVIFGSYEKTVLTFFERTIFSLPTSPWYFYDMPNHLDTTQHHLPCLLHLSAGTGCNTAKSLGISSCSGKRPVLMGIWSLLDADCMLRKVLPQWSETVWSWLAQLCKPNSSRGFPEIKTQEDPSSTAGGNKSPSHFPRGFFAPIGFAQPSCSGYGSRRQESQRCQRPKMSRRIDLETAVYCCRSWGFWDVAAVEWLAKAPPASVEFSWFAKLGRYGLCQQIFL